MARELGLKRRETVWSLSTVFNRKLIGVCSSTRGAARVDLWCIDCIHKIQVEKLSQKVRIAEKYKS